MDEDDEEREPAMNMKSDQKMREKSEEANEVDPSFADWLKVEDDNVSAEADPTKDDSATETDDDSENEDVKAEPEEGSLRDWFDIQPEISAAGKLKVYLALRNAMVSSTDQRSRVLMKTMGYARSSNGASNCSKLTTLL